MIRANVVAKIKTSILCSITIFENRAFYEIMWINIAGQATDENTALAHFMLDTKKPQTHSQKM